MIVTESALREQLRQPRAGAQVTVPRGATLSPSAQDLVAHWGLVLVEADPVESPRAGPAGRASWDRPSTFPVRLGTATPTCTTCGGPVDVKPDALTQLDACHLAPKTHPRIRLRGRVDSLQALALLTAARAREAGSAELARHLGTVAAYCRELMSAEYNERAAGPVEVDGLDEAAVHDVTHDPRGRLGVDHLTPGAGDPELLHWLNLLRCEVREVEVLALEAFGSPHHPYGASVVHGLNRLSSVVYYLELKLVAAGGSPW
ncbi:hypothetical protein [Actinotalea sp. K2]|uniref:hypothetical protein n=1 Tax=Actinotalea sp. K2 TaxID=2939438 RepID=UPI0020179F11|nr:hypothetical protein [Actinotalea sp. K2]MCL3859791.1 hypothetical protein [Actinotalea sp. K2]